MFIYLYDLICLQLCERYTLWLLYHLENHDYYHLSNVLKQIYVLLATEHLQSDRSEIIHLQIQNQGTFN